MKEHHGVIDTDSHFKIDGVTRTVTNVSELKKTLMQGDHNSERFTFELPRYIDGHDMSECNVCQIHYLNIGTKNGEVTNGLYEVSDLQVDSDNGDIVTLSWLISNNVTKYVGGLNFVIRFACVNDNGGIRYVWNTAVYKGIKVSTSICNSEEIVTEYADILEEWRQKLFSTYESIVDVHLKANEWTESKDMTHYTQDVVILNATEKTKVDLQPSPEQLVSMINSGIIMFVANDNGNIKVYSVGEKPDTDIVIQATIKEVSL